MFAALPVGVAGMALAGAQIAQAQRPVGGGLTAVINNFVSGVGGFVGTIRLTGTQVVNGALTGNATLVGNVLDGLGAVVGSITQAVTGLLSVSGTCQILNLVLGPLDLNLLGLRIQLNQVVLNITAIAGAGNLLGNLLCAVANLLNAGGPLANLLTQLSTLLNQILGALG